METQALDELRDHAEASLYPFPERTLHLKGTDADFNSDIFIFQTNLLIVWRELKRNMVGYPIDDARRYVAGVLEILQNVRLQVNQYFKNDMPEDNEYNKTLQQVEAEGVSNEPDLGLTPEDSISEDKLEYPVRALALHVNKVCLWAERQFTGALSAPTEPEQIELQDAETINEKLLLLKYTGVFDFIETSCRNKNKTAAVVAAIIGEKTDSIRVISTHLNTPHKKNRLSPYTAKAVANVLMILRKLEFNTDELEKIYNNLTGDHKN